MRQEEMTGPAFRLCVVASALKMLSLLGRPQGIGVSQDKRHFSLRSLVLTVKAEHLWREQILRAAVPRESQPRI